MVSDETSFGHVIGVADDGYGVGARETGAALGSAPNAAPMKHIIVTMEKIIFILENNTRKHWHGCLRHRIGIQQQLLDCEIEMSGFCFSLSLLPLSQSTLWLLVPAT